MGGCSIHGVSRGYPRGYQSHVRIEREYLIIQRTVVIQRKRCCCVRGTRKDGEVVGMQDRQDELGRVMRMVEAQQRVIDDQSRIIEEMKRTMDDVLSEKGTTTRRRTKGPMVESLEAKDDEARKAIREAGISDRRLVGLFDARYHSTSPGSTPQDYRILPKRIILVRHAESEGNVNNQAYTYLPDPQVPLTQNGWKQALEAGMMMKKVASDTKLFFYTSPYLRSRQTYEGVSEAFGVSQVAGVQEEVQLREQDFGNFQDAEGKRREKAERMRFGRFFYRFPNGESGADVYDRMTLFEDHLVRDINAGRFAGDTSLVLVTHGLAARIFLMRWFHWTVDQFMRVYNPPNAVPLVLERILPDESLRAGGPAAWIHTKALYKLSDDSMKVLQGCTPDMCTTSWLPRGLSEPAEKKSFGPPREVHELLESMDEDPDHYRNENPQCDT